MNTRAVSANLSSTHEIISLNVIINNEEALTLNCNKLVIAAGPWTPAVFKKLFPNSIVKFEPVISASEWFLFENPAPPSNRSIGAACFDKIVGHKLAFTGRSDRTIFATGEQSDIGAVPDVGDVSIPDPGSLAKLKAYADTFLKRSHGSKQELRVIDQGRAYRPVTRTRLPVLAGIPACKLSTERCYAGNTSVYVNSGHGSYGVTLGMGSGKVMSQIVLGEETDVDVSNLGPLYG